MIIDISCSKWFKTNEVTNKLLQFKGKLPDDCLL
jgi:hypothetical protein